MQVGCYPVIKSLIDLQAFTISYVLEQVSILLSGHINNNICNKLHIFD